MLHWVKVDNEAPSHDFLLGRVTSAEFRANRKKLADKIELAHLDPTKKVSMPSNLKV